MRMLVCALALACMIHEGAPQTQRAATPPRPDASSVLDRDQVEKIMPATVFFRGQTATTQGRNSAGIRLKGGKLILAAIVDSGGYSSGLAERYQAYLLTEVGVRVGGTLLVPGAYGFGFVKDDRVVLMDIGGNEVLNAATVRNGTLKRPVPLQIVSEGGAYHLYLGRSYVTLAPEAEK